jgi:hypothetical protein
MPRRQPAATCFCGQLPFVGKSRSAKNPGRIYATCARFRGSEEGELCKYFAWLDATEAPPAPPSTPAKVPAGPGQCGSPQQEQTRSAAAAKDSPSAGRTAPAPASDAREGVVAMLFVVSEWVLCPSAQPCERVQLILLRASAHSPADCTQHLARQPAAGQLPWAPASLRSLQPPYVTVRHCPSARGLAAALGWGGPGCGGLFVLDSETTGLSGEAPPPIQLCRGALRLKGTLLSLCRPRPHSPAGGAEPAVLPAAHRAAEDLPTQHEPCSGAGARPARLVAAQRASLLAAALGPTIHLHPLTIPQVCGASNLALHDPNRPTFGQLAPLLHAFIAAGSLPASTATGPAMPPLLVAHNAQFDARLLIGEWTRRGLPIPREWRCGASRGTQVACPCGGGAAAPTPPALQPRPALLLAALRPLPGCWTRCLWPGLASPTAPITGRARCGSGLAWRWRPASASTTRAPTSPCWPSCSRTWSR